MINEKSVIGIYWSERKDSLEECLEKLYKTFLFLSEFDESFKSWYNTKKIKKGEKAEPILLNKNSIKDILLLGQNYNDDGSLNTDLGYLVYLKSNKEFSDSHVLSIICGSINKAIKNSVIINLSKQRNLQYLTEKDTMQKIYFNLAKIWMPESGVIKRNNIELNSW